MKVSFYSNYLLHHQVPFCNEMYTLLGDDFMFIATERIPQERLRLGYSDLSEAYSYCLNIYENEENIKKAYLLSLKSDIVIIGSAPDIYLRDRVLKGKITFRYSERFFKLGKWRIIDPRVALAHFKRDFRYRNYNNLFMLCAGAYAAPDCRLIMSYPHRTYKWGYFTAVKNHDVPQLMLSKRNSFPKMIWAGRFIDWKHPEIAIEITKKLIHDGINVKLDFIGQGPLENDLKKMVCYYNLGEYINFLGAMPPEKVIENMEKANIFLFTSDRQEGWGAVLNESMSSGCAVIANKMIGSVPYLINDGQNGLIYDGTIKSLYSKVEKLVLDIEMCERLGKNAYITIGEKWNPKIAAKRFIDFSQGVMNGEIKYYNDGPMSKAE